MWCLPNTWSEQANSRPQGVGFRSAGFLCCGSLLAVAAYAMPVRMGVVQGTSMEPTLRSGQCFFYKPDTSNQEPIRRGDIVVVRLGGQVCVKRVFALGGDRFWVVGQGTVPDRYNWTPIEMGVPISRFRKRFPTFHYSARTMPKNTVYVLGDGCSSLDSRELGPVPVRAVLGRVIVPDAGDPSVSSATLAWTREPARPPRKQRS